MSEEEIEIRSDTVYGTFHFLSKPSCKIQFFKLQCKKLPGEGPQAALHRLAQLAKRVLQRRRDEGG